MGSTSHVVKELGKVVRDHSKIDGRIVYCCTHLRFYLYIDFCQRRVVKSCDSLVINSSSLLLHGST